MDGYFENETTERFLYGNIWHGSQLRRRSER